MRKTAKYITNFILFFCGIIILSHGIIPHDHHFELFHSDKAKTLCENEIQEKHGHDTALHCHAFNLLTLEKSKFHRKNQSKSKSLHLSTEKNKIIVLYVYKCIVNFDKQLSFYKSLNLHSPQLRAPPTA